MTTWTRSERSRLLATILALVAVVAALLPAASALGQAEADYPIAGGRFFTQTGGGGGNGYSVVDGGTDAAGRTIRLWSEYQRLGGIITLGYPASRRFEGPGGFVYQAFQRGVLQWRHDQDRAVLSNVFQWLEEAGKDPFLKTLGIPEPIKDDGSGGDFIKAVQIRTGWLTHEAIRAHFLASPNPGAIPNWNLDLAMQFYGLPMSRPEDAGPFVVQRFQRIAFQYWEEDVAGQPPKGSVVGILGGDLAKQAGLIPADAAAPEPPPNGAAPTATPTPGSPTASPTPTLTPVPGTPTATLTPAPGTPTATATFTSTPVPSTPTATVTAVSGQAFSVASIREFPNCGTTYVRGLVKDRGGAEVRDVRVRTWNDFGNETVSVSGSGGRSTGYWDRIIGPGPRGGKWYAAVVDGNSNPISPIVTLNFTDSCEAGGVQEIELNWTKN